MPLSIIKAMKTCQNDLTFPLNDLFLLEATQSKQRPQKITELLKHIEETDDWEALLNMAYHHALIPQLYTIFSRHRNLIPHNCLTQTEALNEEIIFENIKLGAELIQLTRILEKNALPYISIKGPALAQELYQDVTKRQISDLDILVSEHDLLAIANILLERGFQSSLPLSLLSNSGFIALDNDFTFLHHTKKIMVELHWKLFPVRHKMPLEFETLHQNARAVILQKHPVTILSPEDNLLYLSLHATKHLFEQLKWLCDIDRLVRNSTALDLERVLETADKIEVSDALLLALLMSKELYHTPLPDQITERRSPHIEKLLHTVLHYFGEDFTTLAEPQKKKIRYLFLQQLNHTKQNRLLALFLATFKPSSVDYIYYQLPEKLNFLYPLLRGPRLLYKYGLKRWIM